MAEVHEACNTYVSMLKARRAEEEQSRVLRSQRRANAVISNTERYRRRTTQARRRVMEQKLAMSSAKEQELFNALDEQSKWRHVMYQNVLNRDEQEAGVRAQQERCLEEHLTNLADHERARFGETMRDDAERWEDAKSLRQEAEEQKRRAVCEEVVEDVLSLAFNFVDFADRNELTSEVPRGGSVFELVPPLIRAAETRQQVYAADAKKVQESLCASHLSLGEYAADPDGEPKHNPLFASLVHKLLHIQHPKPEPFKPKDPHPRPIVALLGAKYSGKSAVARHVAEALGMLCINDVQLVQQAVAELERDLTAEELADDRVGDLVDLGREVRLALNDGEAVSAELMAKLILREIAAAREDGACNGVILDGIPTCIGGFQALESELCGYDPNRRTQVPDELLAPLLDGVNIDDPILDIERADNAGADTAVPTGKESKKEQPKKQKKKDEAEEPLPPIDLPVVEEVPPLAEEEEAAIAASKDERDIPGISSVVHVECTAEEIFARFAGLRIDTETGRVFHLELDPPPLDRVPFLVPRDRSDVDTTRLHEALEAYSERWSTTANWLSQFGDLLSAIDGSKPLDEMKEEAVQMVSEVAAKAEEYYNQQMAAADIVVQREELQKMFEERSAERESIRRQLAALYSERGVDPLPVELHEPPKVQQEEPKTLQIPQLFPALFLRVLDDFTVYFADSVSALHKELVALLGAMYAHGKYCVDEFSSYWRQPDPKQKLLDSFVIEFNAMMPALRRDVQGKEELHLRTDGLSESLASAVDRRREEGHSLIETLCNRTTFLDGWCDAVRVVGAAIAQLETERFFIVKHLSILYFSALKNEPFIIDDAEMLVDVMPVPRHIGLEPATPEPAAAVKGGKEKKPPPPKKGAAKAAEDAADKTPEDIFAPVPEKCIGAIKQAVEKMQQPVAAAPTGKEKAAKKNAAPEVVSDQPTPLSLSLPIVQSEMQLSKRRLEVVSSFAQGLATLGTERNNTVQAKLTAALARKQASQMGAVNGAVFHIRGSIEEERSVQFRLTLGCDDLAVDRGMPLPAASHDEEQQDEGGDASKNIFDEEDSEDPMILSCLSLSRAKLMVDLFKKTAPSFRIFREDFCRIVERGDFTPGGCTTCSPDTLFERFDEIRCGAIDWREFMMHLLFFCEPQISPLNTVSSPGGFGNSEARNMYHVEPPSLLSLFDMRADLGSEPLVHEDFEEAPMFFEGKVSEERVAAFRSVIWECFSEDGQTLDPNTLVLFCCNDEQPLRGIQKAFAMAAPVGDETCAVDLDSIYKLFHFSAANAAAAHIHDPHDWPVLEALFHHESVKEEEGGGPDGLTFQEVCGMHPGRVLLNNTNMYKCKRFDV